MNYIESTIIGILSTQFGVDTKNFNGRNSSLFCSPVNLTSVEFLALIYLLEKKFSIRFNEDEFDMCNFYTLEGLILSLQTRHVLQG